VHLELALQERVGHAPVVGQEGRLYGSLDVACDCGDEQVFQTLAARLPVNAVWVTTPLKRTRETAAALARHHPAPPGDFQVEPLLVEQDFGPWQGLTYTELAADQGEAWQRFWLAPAMETPPGGESFAALVRRVGDTVEALTRRHAGRDIICIGHGGTIRAALAHALGISPQQALSFVIDSCSLTRLDHLAGEREEQGRRGGSWRITVVNNVGGHSPA